MGWSRRPGSPGLAELLDHPIPVAPTRPTELLDHPIPVAPTRPTELPDHRLSVVEQPCER